MGEMTIHAALSYLKTADKRIQKILDNTAFVTCAKVNSDKVNGEPIETAKVNAKSQYQSVSDIIRTVEAIKRAISQSNASTTITVCGQTMTVAEAIYMMTHGIEAKKNLLETLRSQYVDAKKSVDRYNGTDLENKVNKFIDTVYGGKEKATGSEALTAIENFRKMNSYELVDPLDVLKQIRALEDWIDRFEAEVDGAIQVSNATHTIQIED